VAERQRAEAQVEYGRLGPGRLWLRARGRVAVIVLGVVCTIAIPFVSIVWVVYLLR